MATDGGLPCPPLARFNLTRIWCHVCHEDQNSGQNSDVLSKSWGSVCQPQVISADVEKARSVHFASSLSASVTASPELLEFPYQRLGGTLFATNFALAVVERGDSSVAVQLEIWNRNLQRGGVIVAS